MPPLPQPPEPQDQAVTALPAVPEARSHGLTLRRLLWPLGLLTAGLVAAICLLLVFAAREQNSLALQSSQHLATSVLTTEIAEIERSARDYAIWNATVENIILTLDETWAADNIGAWAHDGLEMDASLVLDGQDRLLYAMADGERSDAEILDRFGDGLAPLVAAARAAEPGTFGIALSGYVLFDGGIAAAAASPIVWEDGRAAPERGGAPSVLVYLRRFDAEILDGFAQNFLLTDLHVAGPAEALNSASLPLASYDGRLLGRLAWTAEQPGFRMLKPLLLPGALGAAVFLLLLAVVIRRTRRTVHELESSHAALQQQAGALALARDRAEQQRRTEAELRRRAVDASRAKSEFLALVSHELRTPLNAILGFSETIATQAFGQGVNDRYRSYASDIHESGRHLLSIINDILDLTKVEAGRYELHEEDVELGELLQRCSALLRERAAAKHITLACAPCSLRLHADERALKQVVINLLSNAIKFTGAGGRVELRAESDSETTRILVIDNGIGMSEDDLARAQQPFGQAASAHTRTVEGTGLGLNVTQALVQLHGGRLAIRSAPGRGTLVEVRLPAERLLPPLSAPAASA